MIMDAVRSTPVTEGALAPCLVSFIICTRNRANILDRCLASVERAARRRADAPAEIIVVDNGSTDGSAGVVAAFAARSRIAVRPLYLARPGLGAARNLGISAASGAWLVFTDDDCVLAEDYIDDLMRHAAKDVRAVVRGGRVELGDSADLPLTIKTSDHVEHFAAGQFPGGFVHGCNLVIPRAVIAQIGLFDGRFGAGARLRSAEDTDFVLRAHRAGFAIEYVPDMRVSHFHGRRSDGDAERLILNYSYGNGAIYAKHGMALWWLLRFPLWTARSAWREWRDKRMAPRFSVSERRILAANLRGAAAYLRSRFTRNIPIESYVASHPTLAGPMVGAAAAGPPGPDN